MVISSFKRCMKQEHHGIGGLYFISTMIICAFILFSTVRLSWDSQAVAMADNFAYITSINISVNAYIDNVIIPAGNYPGPLPLTNHPYNALNDFNSMLQRAGVTSDPNACKEALVSWNGQSAIVQYGEFKTSLNSMIRPHQQESIIEND